jgi:hypothetical protein
MACLRISNRIYLQIISQAVTQMAWVGYRYHHKVGLQATTSSDNMSDKTIVFKDEMAAYVLIQAAGPNTPRPALHPPSYHLISRELLARTFVMR